MRHANYRARTRHKHCRLDTCKRRRNGKISKFEYFELRGRNARHVTTNTSPDCPRSSGSAIIWFSILKSQVVYSKQPKLGLTQEFVVDCAHALWVVHSIKRLVSLMLLKWFLSDSFIYFMYRMFNDIFLIGWLCVWILSLPCHMHK